MRRPDRMALFALPKTRPWTDAEVNYLIFRCEKYGYDELAARLNRTVADVKAMMDAEKLSPLCGVYSISRACRETGYAPSQLYRARNNTRMTWRRRKGGAYAITEEQLERLTDYLRDEGRPDERPDA